MNNSQCSDHISFVQSPRSQKIVSGRSVCFSAGSGCTGIQPSSPFTSADVPPACLRNGTGPNIFLPIGIESEVPPLISRATSRADHPAVRPGFGRFASFSVQPIPNGVLSAVPRLVSFPSSARRRHRGVDRLDAPRLIPGGTHRASHSKGRLPVCVRPAYRQFPPRD